MPDGSTTPQPAVMRAIGPSRPGLAHAGPEEARSTPLEAALAAVWKSVLELDEIAVDDDFFLLGGDSLTAAALFTEVSAVFAVDLPLKAIFDDASSIEGMARIIEEARSAGNTRPACTSTSTEVVVMNGGGNLPPLFAVGGSGGHSIGFAHVARMLGPDQPFFGLDSVGLDGADEPLIRMADIAADHIRRMRRVQPDGPYHLIGACFGGRVVYEMTQQLLRAGQEIGLTILLDPSPPFKGREARAVPPADDAPRLTRSKAARRFILGRLRLYRSELRALPWSARGRYLFGKLKVAREVGMTGDLHRVDPAHRYREAVFTANKMAGASYTATPCPAPVAVFWSRDRAVGSRRHRADWLSLLDNRREMAEVPGRDSGDMMLPPHAAALAGKIADALRLARTPKAGDTR